MQWRFQSVVASVQENKINESIEPAKAIATGNRVSNNSAVLNSSVVPPHKPFTSFPKVQKPLPKEEEVQQNGNGTMTHQSPSPKTVGKKFVLKNIRNSDSGTVSEDGCT